MKVMFLLTATILVLTSANVFSQPALAVKTNLVYGIATLTPNLGVELGIAGRSSLSIAGSINAWNSVVRSRIIKSSHTGPSNGHYIGGHVFAAHYNIAGA